MPDTIHANPDYHSLLLRVASGLSALRGIGDAAPSGTGDFTLQFDEWDWEIGVGLFGLLRLAEATENKALIGALEGWFDWQIERGLPPKQVNSTAPMLPLVGLIDHVNRPDWDALCKDWADWLVTGLARTQDDGFQHVVKERANDGELWDDTLFMTALFLAKAGRKFDRPDWVEEAVYQFLVHARYLSDPATGLWYHGWTFNGRNNFAGAFWGRGNAWATIAIPELFNTVPDLAPSARRYLASVLESQVGTLEQLQRADGFFNTLLDDPKSPIESSATAGIAYGVLRGVSLGLLDGDLLALADQARQAVLQCIGDDGIVTNVSDGTPMGHTLDFYREIPNTPTPYGQALTMLLLVETLISASK